MKSSFRPRPVLVGIGLLLMLAAASFVVFNERNVIQYRDASGRHGGEFTDLDRNAYPAPALDGRMVRVTGVPHIIQAPVDPAFRVTADATRLQRVVDMFQWHEIKVGGQISYQMDWLDHHVDWHRFDQPAGHANPSRFPFHAATFAAPKVRLGGFRLSAAMIAALHGFQACQPDMSRLPANLQASFRTYQGALTSSADPVSPQLGDLKVSWLCVRPTTITVLAQVQGNRLVAARHSQIAPGFEVQIGDRSLGDILPDVPAPPGTPWLWRATALCLAWVGAFLVSRGWRRPRLEPLATLGFALAIVCGFAGTLWVGTAWQLGLILLAVTVAAAAAAACLLRLPPDERRQYPPPSAR